MKPASPTLNTGFLPTNDDTVIYYHSRPTRRGHRLTYFLGRSSPITPSKPWEPAHGRFVVRGTANRNNPTDLLSPAYGSNPDTLSPAYGNNPTARL